jgi:Putative zinc-finger
VECSEAGTMLDELALDVLPGDRRAALLQHVEECPDCRHLLDELSETADALLLAGPVVAPPPGFGSRVLDRIQAPRARARNRNRTRLRLFAAAAAAAMLLAVGGVVGARFGRSGGGDAGREFQTVQLVSTDGSPMGDVSLYAGPPAWFFMRLTAALPDGKYQCVLDTDDGHSVPVGKLWLSGAHGAWGDHVSLDPRHIKAARLLDPDGSTVATARLS